MIAAVFVALTKAMTPLGAPVTAMVELQQAVERIITLTNWSKGRAIKCGQSPDVADGGFPVDR